MTEAGPVSRRNRPAKPALSRSTIIDAALAILDADGVDAVSMRRVAQALDTGAASLYVYVRNRDELLGLLLDRIVEEVPLPSPGAGGDGSDWREQLTALILDSIQVLGRHGGIASVTFANIPTGPNALAFSDLMIGLLAQGGISRQATAWAIDLIALHIAGAGTEQAIFRQQEADGSPDHHSGISEVFATLSRDVYPNLAALRPELMQGTGEQRARWAIDVLIEGILAVDRKPT